MSGDGHKHMLIVVTTCSHRCHELIQKELLNLLEVRAISLRKYFKEVGKSREELFLPSFNQVNINS